MKYNLQKMIGMSLGKATNDTGLVTDRNFVIEEPPGVARGIMGVDKNGNELFLYIARGSVGSKKSSEWKLDDFINETVIGVAVEYKGKWVTEGRVIGYYHINM